MPVDSGVCRQGRLSQRQGQPPSLCRSPPSPLAAPRFPLNLLLGVAGGDLASCRRASRSQGRSPAAEGVASPPTAFSVGTWGGGWGVQTDVWPCWCPSYSREYSWGSVRVLAPLPVEGQLCVPWRAGLDECAWEGRRVHLSALGYVTMCVWCDPPIPLRGSGTSKKVETRGCLHPTAEILILPCGLQIPIFIYKLSYPICPVELIRAGPDPEP